MKTIIGFLEEISAMLLTIIAMLLSAAVESECAFVVILVIIALIWIL